MKDELDYYDIQGNIMINYAEFGYIKARYLFLEITSIEDGLAFVKEIQQYITPCKLDEAYNVVLPEIATNIAFSYNGLKRLGLPVLTLQSFPDEFIVGMRGRRAILGDDASSSAENWDEVYKKNIHIFISIDARTEENIQKRFAEIEALLVGKNGITLLSGHGADDNHPYRYQDASALYENGMPTAKEHFGYSDGISNPYFKGMTEDMGNLLGGGKKIQYGNPELATNWAPLETGEFILGYKDEAQEYPAAPTPPLISKNGSFMVFNKFHENVGKFNDYLETTGTVFPGGKEALAAKFVGRWRNGAPLASFPTEAQANEIALKRQQAIQKMVIAQTPEELQRARQEFKKVNLKFTAYDYENDLEGSRCPVGAHTRRANPRGSLEFGNKGAFDSPTALDNRRRMIRRGLPYGNSTPESNTGEHGTIIMTIVASIKRQFEFVFQQWLNYGNDFKLANDKDPIMGNHRDHQGRMVVQGNTETLEAPYFLSEIPRFVENRGGEYLFIPSMTALRMIGEGIVDPT